MRFLFRKDNRLYLENEIEQLFSEGKSITRSPIKLIYRIFNSESPDYKVLITVSKKNLRKAAQRNTIKRRIREIIRKRASIIRQSITLKKVDIHIAIVYISKEIISSTELEEIIDNQLQILNNKISRLGERQ